MSQSRPVVQALLAALGATCVALITTRLDTSPTANLIAAALAAAVPILITTGSPGAVALGILVTAMALGVTYIGFTAAAPETFAGSEDLRRTVGVKPAETTETTVPTQNVTVPDVVRKTYAEAKETVEGAGLKAERKDVELNEEPQGTVVDQDPDAGESAEKGSSVELSVTPVAVPDVRNQTKANAESQLTAFTVEVKRIEVSDPAQDDLVLDQIPVETMAAPGTVVTLTVGTYEAPP